LTGSPGARAAKGGAVFDYKVSGKRINGRWMASCAMRVCRPPAPIATIWWCQLTLPT